MGDTYWMDDIVRVDWEEVKPVDPTSRSKSPFVDAWVEKFIFQNTQYPMSDTGSHILMPEYRRNIIKIDFEPRKIEVAICLN